MAIGWIALITDGGLVPADDPELPSLAIDAASIELFGTLQPPRFPASLLAARALRSSSGRDGARVGAYPLAIRLALQRTSRQALAIALDAMPFGQDCSGIGDAALRYMHQPLRQLDPAKIVALAVLARSPEEYLGDPAKWRADRDLLLRTLRDHGVLGAAVADEALSRPVVPATWEVRPH